MTILLRAKYTRSSTLPQ